MGEMAKFLHTITVLHREQWQWRLSVNCQFSFWHKLFDKRQFSGFLSAPSHRHLSNVKPKSCH